MISVLFVDDEQSLLDGQRRALRNMRDQWDMHFANSGAAALAMFEEIQFDVIISDMRMPRMDGIELLKRVRQMSPRTIRIVLSGQTDLQEALQSASLAQVFLHKPCERAVLEGAVRRSVALAEELNSPKLQRIVGSLDSLPSAPRVVAKLNEYLTTADVKLDEVVSIMDSDPGILAKLLQLANSLIFGSDQNITNAHDAVKLLGVGNIKYLAVASALFSEEHFNAAQTKRFSEIEERAVLSVRVAKALHGNAPVDPAILSAVILHGVGELVIAVALPDEDSVFADRVRAGELRVDIEKEVLGVTNATVGAYLLNLWDVPMEIVEATAWQHTSPPSEPWERSALHVVYVTEAVVSKGRGLYRDVPYGYLDALDFAESVETALQVVGQSEAVNN